MKYSFPCVQGVTKGFREDVALREGYWKEGFSLETATKSASQSCWGGEEAKELCRRDSFKNWGRS